MHAIIFLLLSGCGQEKPTPPEVVVKENCTLAAAGTALDDAEVVSPKVDHVAQCAERRDTALATCTDDACRETVAGDYERCMVIAGDPTVAIACTATTPCATTPCTPQAPCDLGTPPGGTPRICTTGNMCNAPGAVCATHWYGNCNCTQIYRRTAGDCDCLCDW